jgi:hypothetical protein
MAGEVDLVIIRNRVHDPFGLRDTGMFAMVLLTLSWHNSGFPELDTYEGSKQMRTDRYIM